MKRTKNFSELHKRVTILSEPVWICISSKQAGSIPIGQFSELCDHKLFAFTSEEEQEDFKSYAETGEKP